MKLPNLSKKHAIAATVAALALCTAGITAALALAPVVESTANAEKNATYAVDIPSGTDSVVLSMTCPISDTSEYRYVSLSFGGEMKHLGTDIVTQAGTDILAAADGTVVDAQEGGDSPYGNHVILSHENGYKTLYGHCDTLLVKKGDTIKQGQTIATVGETGYATGPHLHFEVRKGVDAVDAEDYIEITNTAPTK